MAWLVNKVMLFFCGNNIYSVFSKISALWSLKEQGTCRSRNIRVKVFMNVWSKLCGRQPLNILSDFKFLKAVFQILLGLFLNTLTHMLPINQRRVRPSQTSMMEFSCFTQPTITCSKLTTETPLSISIKNSIIEVTSFWCLYC